MDTRRLELFMGVVREGGLNKAARALHLAPQSLSEQVAKLEREVGVPLFERLPSGMRPTRAGEVLLDGAERLLAYEDDLLRRCRESAVARRLTIGQYPLSFDLSDLRSRVEEACPGLEVKLAACRGVEGEMLESIRDGMIDIAEWTGDWVPDEMGLRFEQLGEVEILCLANPQNPLASKEAITFADLASSHVAVGSSLWFEGLADAMRAEGHELRLEVIGYGFQQIQGYCIDSGDLFLMTSAYAPIMQGLKAMPIDPAVHVPWGMVFRSLDDPGVAACIEAMRELRG